MISVSEYFAGIYQEMPKPVLVFDAKMQPVYCSASGEQLLPRLGHPLPSAVLRAAERCREELRGATLSVQVAEQELTLYLTPSVYEAETYLVLMAELSPEYPELSGLMQVLRNAHGKLNGYLNGIYSVAQKIGLDTPDGKALGLDVRRTMRMADHLQLLLDAEKRIPSQTLIDVGRFAAVLVRNLNEIGLDKTILTAPYEPDMMAIVVPEDIERVLRTLISNALRFGGGKVTVWTSRAEDKIYITVADNGPGVGDPDRLFEWGYRTPDNKGVVGVGLSLPMAKKLLDQQGASLLYERVGDQTCFHIVLDARPIPDGVRLAEWQPEPLENSVSQVYIELSDYIKEMEI